VQANLVQIQYQCAAQFPGLPWGHAKAASGLMPTFSNTDPAPGFEILQMEDQRWRLSVEASAF
jgi:hypothetical protein